MTRISTRTAAVIGATIALVGCTLTQNQLRDQDGALLPPLRQTGRVIVPKLCAIKMVIVSRPAGDPALDEVVWRVADAQVLDDETRRILAANGLRVGLVTGELPSEVRAVLDAPPPNQVSPTTVILPNGDHTVVDLGAQRPELDLLLSKGGTIGGKRYTDARGHIRLSASHQGEDEDGVALRLVPELHHGPMRQGWGTAPGGGTFAPQQLIMRNGQAEETFRDLATTVVLHPGQVAVIGGLPDRKGSLGHFLFTVPEANSDRLSHKVLFVWASRSEPGTESADAEAPGPGGLPAGLRPVDPPAEDAEPIPKPMTTRDGSPGPASRR